MSTHHFRTYTNLPSVAGPILGAVPICLLEGLQLLVSERARAAGNISR